MGEIYTARLDENVSTSELVLTFPRKLIEDLGWSVGDDLVWEVSGDSVILHKAVDLIKSGEVPSTVVPIEPEPECIESMALRYDHSHGLKGMRHDSELGMMVEETDQEFEQRREANRRIARQMYEEAVGQGFFKRGKG